MTVANVDPTITYSGNASRTSFPFSFGTTQEVEVKAYITSALGDNTPLVINTDFSVTGAGSPTGGTVTYPISGSPLASGVTITIYRETDLTQLNDLRRQSGVDSEVWEGMADKLTHIVQEQSRDIERALLSSETGITESEGDLKWVKLSGGTLDTGCNLGSDTSPATANAYTRRGYLESTYVPLAGGVTITGDLSRAADPTSSNHLSRKSYVDDKFGVAAGHDHDDVDSKKIWYANIHTMTTADGSTPQVRGLPLLSSGGGAVVLNRTHHVAFSATPTLTANNASFADVLSITDLNLVSASEYVLLEFSGCVFSGSSCSHLHFDVRFTDGSGTALWSISPAATWAGGASEFGASIMCRHYFCPGVTGAFTVKVQARFSIGYTSGGGLSGACFSAQLID